MIATLLWIGFGSFVCFGLWAFFRWAFNLPIFPIRQFYKYSKEHAADLPKLTYKSFVGFVSLDPNEWSWPEVKPGYYKNCRRYYVWFKTWRDYRLAMRWYSKQEKIKEQHKNSINEMKNTAEFLAVMKQTARQAQDIAEREMAQSEKEVKDILKRLQYDAAAQKNTQQKVVMIKK